MEFKSTTLEQKTEPVMEEKKELDNPTKIVDSTVKLDPVFDRKQRRPRSIDGLGLKLEIQKRYMDPNYVYRWFKGTPQRLALAKSLDWEFVENKELAAEKNSEDTRVSYLVGTLENGNPRRDYLMYLPKKWYDDYQKDKMKRLDLVDEQIKNGSFKSEDMGAETRYIPKKIEIKRGA